MIWKQMVEQLKLSLEREPTLVELLELSKSYEMTPEEIEAQKQSWIRANMSTGDPRFD